MELTPLAQQFKAAIDSVGIDEALVAFGQAAFACGEDRIALGSTDEGEAFKEIGETLMELQS